MSQEQEVKKEESVSFFKKYSPVIDLVASTALSFGTSAYFNGVGGVLHPFALVPIKCFIDYVSSSVDNKLFTAFADNIPGTAALYMVNDSGISTEYGYNSPATKALGLGFIGIGESTVISQAADISTKKFDYTSDHYSFDNTLVTLRFGTYFALKTMLTSNIGTTNAAKGVSGMIAGLVSKNFMSTANYLLNGKEDDASASSVFKDSVAMFVNSYLYGVHDNNIGYKHAGGILGNIAIDSGIEAFDAVLKKDILGNKQEEAIVPKLYNISQSVKDGLNTFKENFFKPSENDYDPDPLIQMDNGTFDYCSV